MSLIGALLAVDAEEHCRRDASAGGTQAAPVCCVLVPIRSSASCREINQTWTTRLRPLEAVLFRETLRSPAGP
jgi:hypothetical protein